MIKLINNYGFKWKNKANCWFKGYLFDKDKLKSDFEILDELEKIQSKEEFEKWLKQNNGCFSVIINKKASNFAAVDNIRTFPLFYTIENRELIITDEPVTMFGKTKAVNQLASLELESAAYVTGNKTLFEGVYQLHAGEYLSFSDKTLHKAFYKDFYTKNINHSGFNTLQIELKDHLENVFEKLVNSLQGRQAVIPLSGGYDSRLIALMLKKMEHNNIYTFTYGRKDNLELTNSQNTAEILNLPWKFINYNESLIGDFVNDDVFIEYFNFAAKGASMFYMQDYFAVKYLYDNKLIDKDAIFIPGHSGDLIAGSHLRETISENTAKDKIINEIYHKTYFQNDYKKYKKQLLGIVKKFVDQIPGKTFAYNIYESWIYYERQAKFIVNSANVFDYFGFEYRLPYWDTKLVEFFKSVPYEYKLYKKLYNKTLEEFFFKPNNLMFKTEIQTSEFEIKKQKIKERIKPFLPKKLKLHFLKKNDWMAYSLITQKLLEDLKRRNIPYNFKADNYNSIISKWYVAGFLNSRTLNSKNSLITTNTLIK